MHFRGFTIDQAAAIRDAVDAAHGLAYDGCHKMYILDAVDETDSMRRLGYSHVVEIADIGPAAAVDQLEAWTRHSFETAKCGLAFITRVGDFSQFAEENEAYSDVVGQSEFDVAYGDEYDDELDED